jgi:hypothetical protein
MLKVEGIHTQYGKIKVLNDVSFEIRAGEIVAKKSFRPALPMFPRDAMSLPGKRS